MSKADIEQSAALALLELCLSTTMPDGSVKVSPLTGNGFNFQHKGRVFEVSVKLTEDRFEGEP